MGDGIDLESVFSSLTSFRGSSTITESGTSTKSDPWFSCKGCVVSSMMIGMAEKSNSVFFSQSLWVSVINKNDKHFYKLILS